MKISNEEVFGYRRLKAALPRSMDDDYIIAKDGHLELVQTAVKQLRSLARNHYSNRVRDFWTRADLPSNLTNSQAYNLLEIFISLQFSEERICDLAEEQAISGAGTLLVFQDAIRVLGTLKEADNGGTPLNHSERY